jgi:hypothetical protein
MEVKWREYGKAKRLIINEIIKRFLLKIGRNTEGVLAN